MLSELKISNFAIIEEQTVQFGSGLNVISGETGSGKSIILNALELILGARPRTHFIREGAEQLEIEGHFDLSKIGTQILDELPDVARGDELVLYRSMARSGKGKVYINGRIGTVSLLEEISQKLINICGQGQHMRLLNPAFHVGLVDEYGGHADILSAYQKTYREYLELSKAVSEFDIRKQNSEQRQAELIEMQKELSAHKIYPGVRAELEGKVKKLESSEKLVEGLQKTLANLAEEQGVLPSISALQTGLHELSRWDGELKKFVDDVHSLKLSAQELERGLMHYLYGLDVDQGTLDGLRSHLAEVARLERKYRTNDGGLLELLEATRLELAEAGRPAQESVLRANFVAKEQEVKLLSEKLSAARAKAGDGLMKAVQSDLRDVNMVEAKLKLEMEGIDLGPQGADHLEFLISSNKGELYKPLRQIASGGELSRIMLVLKKNLRDRSGVNILVFDEVDTGISGAVARAVGQKLKELSQFSQVICITHLAQIASLADRHLLVDKKVGKRTVSIVKVLERQEKVDEIARMLAGYEITKASRESAKELLSSNKE